MRMSEAVLEMSAAYFLQGWMFLSIIIGFWLVVRGRIRTDRYYRVYETVGVLLLGTGLGVLAISLGGARFGP